ncbi:MAG: DUF3244 domain-containing protein [Prevotellaceae bacterium]|jgi:hypothetical protein|nr:DUF3244 domain-containing protein [Prevotellaceae bacterium]
MKNCYLFLFFVSLFCSLNLGATINEDGNDNPIENGNFIDNNKQRSLLEPIQAFKTEQSIQVSFSANSGTISISISNKTGGIVYQQSVNTSSLQQVIINISSFASGEYEIKFVNSQNKYLSGVFEIS